MKKTLLFVLCLGLLNSYAQERYYDKVFTDLTITQDVKYAENYTVITGAPVLEDLLMDVYEPANDTAAQRPLIILMHAGSFLPKGLNTLPFGNKNDSSLVEMCKQFAQRGYVAASVNYRLGWNPLGTQEEKANTIINAVYKSMQDGKSAIRFFRKDAATTNAYKIDPDKVVIGGSNSGGYGALAAGALDKTTELNLFKFLGTNGQPYVNIGIWGDFEGDKGTAGYSNFNHPGYDSDPQMVLNMGGAMGDSSWIEAGEVPMISFHGVADPLTPYATAIVIVASTGDPIVEVSGSLDLSLRATRLGNQNWNETSMTDAISVKARSRSAAIGLYPFPGPANGFEPWGWYDANDPNIANGMTINPYASKPRALMYIDTIMGYFCPRAADVLGLSVTTPVSVDAPLAIDDNINLAPNPANEFVKVSSNFEIKEVVLFNITGKKVLSVNGNGNKTMVINRDELPGGFYLMNVSVGETIVTKKLVLK